MMVEPLVPSYQAMLLGLVCQYAKPLSDIPDLNNILLLGVSDSSLPNHPVIRFCSRVKYMDA